jgi:hypothetical protein
LDISNSLVVGLDSPFDIKDVLTMFDQAIENAGVMLQPAEKTRIRNAIEANIKKDNPVYKLMYGLFGLC